MKKLNDFLKTREDKFKGKNAETVYNVKRQLAKVAAKHFDYKDLVSYYKTYYNNNGDGMSAGYLALAVLDRAVVA